MMKITCSIRVVDIELNEEKICKILGITLVSECVYERKTWPHVKGLILGEVVQCICGLEHTNNMSKSSAAGLTMQCHILHNIVEHCILPRVGHGDEVSTSRHL